MEVRHGEVGVEWGEREVGGMERGWDGAWVGWSVYGAGLCRMGEEGRACESSSKFISSALSMSVLDRVNTYAWELAKVHTSCSSDLWGIGERRLKGAYAATLSVSSVRWVYSQDATNA